MKKITIYIVVALLCLFFKVAAQEPVKPLKVGDKLPEVFWQQEHTIYQNGKTYTQKLSAHRGKLLILDFWATWCGTCINKFPILQSQQLLHNDALVVLLVNTSSTRDTAEKVAELFNGKKPPHKTFTLPSIINDTYLNSLFPHTSLPHYIWINKTGQIFAITNGEFINDIQLVHILKSEQP